jgi:hypothetical protein
MSVPPESIEVGKCYLAGSQLGPRVQRVVAILPNRRVQYEWRKRQGRKWKPGVLDLREFAFGVDREVPCDWTPDQEG